MYNSRWGGSGGRASAVTDERLSGLTGVKDEPEGPWFSRATLPISEWLKRFWICSEWRSVRATSHDKP